METFMPISMENFWSLLKFGLHGTYISVEPFHLFRDRRTGFSLQYSAKRRRRNNQRRRPIPPRVPRLLAIASPGSGLPATRTSRLLEGRATGQREVSLFAETLGGFFFMRILTKRSK